MFGPPSRCRDCGSTRFHRSRQRDWLRTVCSFVCLRPYRCDSCGRRIWRFGLPTRQTARLHRALTPQFVVAGRGPGHPPQSA